MQTSSTDKLRSRKADCILHRRQCERCNAVTALRNLAPFAVRASAPSPIVNPELAILAHFVTLPVSRMAVRSQSYEF